MLIWSRTIIFFLHYDNCMTIVHFQMKVLDVCCRWPGSAHDATIFANSSLHERFERGEYGRDSVILGDSAYGTESYVFTYILLRNAITQGEKKYQSAQITARNVVERTFGLLKRRFPCLDIGMHFHLNKMQDIIVACCILHNIIICEKNVDNNVTQPEIDFQGNLGQQLIDAQQLAVLQGQREIRAQKFSCEFALRC